MCFFDEKLLIKETVGFINQFINLLYFSPIHASCCCSENVITHPLQSNYKH